MSQQDKVVYLQNSQAVQPAAHHDAYVRVQQHAITQLNRLLTGMLDHVDDALFERADKAATNQLQSSFFMAMRQLRLSRRQLESDFQKGLEQAFTALKQSPRKQSEAAPVKGEGLALLDNEALESSIAIDGMIAKARTQEAKRLLQLQRCLAILLPQQRIDENNSPLDPAQIVNAFASASSEVDIELAPRLILYKLFDTRVMSGVGGLYEDIYQQLTQAGVRPATPRVRQGTSASQQRTTSSRQPVSGQEQSAQPLLEGLRQLLSDQAAPGLSAWLDAPASAAPTAATLDLGDLIGALSQMQQRVQPSAGQGVKQALGQYLALKPGTESQQVGTLEGAAIDIVGMLFDVILDDPRLPPRIKALLARLQIPVLKASLLDGAFFSSKQHPARRLINEMAKAATGWVEPEQLEKDPLYRQVSSIVERILSEFEDDPQLFSDLLDDFLIFQEEEQERARLVEERTRQAAEGQARIEQAKSRVSEEIQRRVQGRKLPEVVYQLLGGPWSKVLFLAYLKEQEDQAEWERKLDVADRLIASVQRQETAEARREQLLVIPELLQDLRDGLNAILFNPFEMTQLFQQLEAVHVHSLAAPAESVEPVAAPPADIAPELVVTAPSDQPPAEEPDPELLPYLQQLDELPLGAWLELEQGGARVRAKLSARLNEGRQLIFVNRAGFKMSERTRLELAEELRAGQVVILDDDQLFDKALESVIANLRQTRAGMQ